MNLPNRPALRLPVTPTLRNSITKRKALLTALSLRKALRTSGSRRTRLVPAWYRFAYLPRTLPLSNWPRSYSGRKSSFVLFFLVFTGLL
jgi:hypothetical protein